MLAYCALPVVRSVTAFMRSSSCVSPPVQQLLQCSVPFSCRTKIARVTTEKVEYSRAASPFFTQQINLSDPTTNDSNTGVLKRFVAVRQGRIPFNPTSLEPTLPAYADTVQGWMTETILPFESEEEMRSEFTQRPDPKVISSYWADELQEDGSVQRSPQRMAGTEDLTDWAQAVAAALVTRSTDATVHELALHELAMEDAAGACQSIHFHNCSLMLLQTRPCVVCAGESCASCLHAALSRWQHCAPASLHLSTSCAPTVQFH